MTYEDIVNRRRALRIPGYATLEDVGFDGPWITPYQMISRSPDGPVLVADNWLDVPSVHENEAILRRLGYLPDIKFNVVMDMALLKAGLGRSEIYVTQAFHLLPATRSADIATRDVNVSFDQVTRHELRDRHVVAMGDRAAAGCRKFAIPHVKVPHPSARRGTYAERAAGLAAAILRGRAAT